MSKKFSLKTLATTAFGAVLLLVCVGLSFIGYKNADAGFVLAVEDKAQSDIRAVQALLDADYAGSWDIRDGKLTKGDKSFVGLTEELERYKTITGDHITIFQGDTRVATTFVDKNGSRPVGTQASAPVISTVLNGGKIFVGSANVLGTNYLCAYDSLKNKNGKPVGMVFVGVPTEDIEQLQTAFIKKMTVSAAVAIIVVGLLSFFAIGRITDPIHEICNRIGKIAEGDIRKPDHRIESRIAEIHMISDAMAKMRGNLSSIVGTITNSAQQMAASSQELTASASQTAEAATSVAQSVTMASGAVESQRHAIQESAANITTVSATLEEIQAESHEASVSAANVSDAAKRGGEAVVESVDQIRSVESTVEAGAEIVEKLGRRSKEIGQIVDSISAIADQTNLLALNAAIEAARAGEAGRGFSVVAEEVRKLAEQSGEAAKNISNLIREIQNETEAAVQAMADGREKVKTGAATVESLQETFERIVADVVKISTDAGNIAGSVRQVSESAQGLSEEIAEVDQQSNKVSDEMQSVSAATQEQSASAQEIASASDALAHLAQELQEALGFFAH